MLKIKIFLNLLIVIALLFSFLSNMNNFVIAQTQIEKIKINHIDYSSFPDVSLSFQLLDSNGLLLPNILKIDSINLTENGDKQEYELRPADLGIQIAFVVDLGAGITTIGATGQPRYREMLQVITTYVEQMSSNDEMSVYIQKGKVNSTLFESESDKSTIKQYLSKLDADASQGVSGNSFGLDALRLSLTSLGKSISEKHKATIFLSSGIQDTSQINKQASVEEMSKSLNIPIYPVLFRATETEDTYVNMRRLAEKSNGTYVHFRSGEILEEFFSKINFQKQQYEIFYRSDSIITSERVVEISLNKVTIPPRASISYQVNPQPPLVLINKPKPESQIHRQAMGNFNDTDLFEPASLWVDVDIEWIDGYQPRQIESAELIVDGISENYQPNPGENISLAWDLRKYLLPGQNITEIRVKVIDELGIESISEPSRFEILVDADLVSEVLTLDENLDVCAEKSGFNNFICEFGKSAGWFALAIALIALSLVVFGGIFIFRNREKLLQLGGDFKSVAKDAWQRVTGGQKEKASAYLTVLTKSYLQHLDMHIPIYKNTPTTIGRNPMTNKIVIPDNREEPEISKEHIKIWFNDDEKQWKILDIGSTNGSRLSDIPLRELEEEALEDGDEITLGKLAYGGIKFLFRIADSRGELPGIEDRDRITN